MGQLLLALVLALTVASVAFGVIVLMAGDDSGLVPAEPDGRAVPLPGSRPLAESDLAKVRFDLVLRGYRMAQVDQALRRAAYDIGYKDELIGVLEAEVAALREGRSADAEALRRAREAAVGPVGQVTSDSSPSNAASDPGESGPAGPASRGTGPAEPGAAVGADQP
ncbi:MAG TPA: DivIVA domain-containing protein [Micromonosporaceae bacterium]|nr:DivIVA domain-containing protein [Micromonosporaceae bacterium]